MLGKMEGKRRREHQNVRWLDGITDAMNMNLSKLWDMVRDREAWHDAVHGVTNAEFQRTARRDKKAFFNEQCLIIEENNKRKKTRDLFRKIGNIEGAFFPKMCTIKDKNGRDIVC